MSHARSATPSHFRRRLLALPSIGILALGTAALLVLPNATAGAATAPVGMGTAGSYAVLAGTTVTNTGPSVISGNLGVNPGTAVTGFPPGLVNNGVIHSADAHGLQAQSDLTIAYDDAAGRTPATLVSADIGDETLAPGVYKAASALALTGTVTLDAQSDPNAVFIFQAGSSLITAPNSTVNLIGGANPCNVYWQVGSSAILGLNTTFVGTIMALTSITLETGTTVAGRVLARNGQVALDTNVITRPNCSPPTTTTTPPPTTTDTTTTTEPPTTTTTTPPVTPTTTTPPVTTTPPDTTTPTTVVSPPVITIPSIPETTPDVPASPRGPNNPDNPDNPGTPGAPGSPDAPEAPEAPEAPGSPQAPGAPGSQGAPRAPGAPGSPGAPDSPGGSQSPAPHGGPSKNAPGGQISQVPLGGVDTGDGSTANRGDASSSAPIWIAASVLVGGAALMTVRYQRRNINGS